MGKKTNKIKGIMGEFKAFVMRGNVIDMAIGVVMATTFNKIVSSLVGDIIMPAIGLLIGGADFSGFQYPLNVEGAIKYGVFIQAIIDFVIIAFCMFVVIKIMSALNRKKEEPKPEPPKKSDEVQLLEEIRDLLKEKK